MEALNDAAYAHTLQADAPALVASGDASLDALDAAGGGAGGGGADVPQDAAAKAALKSMRKADLEQLRALRATHSLKDLAATPLAAKHGWSSKEKLKDALRVRPRVGSDAALAAKAERATRGPLTEEMLAEMKRRVAAGEALADVRKSDPSLLPFPLDLLRRRVDGVAVRRHQCRTAVGYKGLTMLKSGKFQVQYKKRYVGLFATAEEAALAWNRAAIADGVPADALNVLPPPGAGEAAQAAAMVADAADADAADDAADAAVM